MADECSCSTSNWAAGVGWSCCCCCFIIVIVLAFFMIKSSSKGESSLAYLARHGDEARDRYAQQKGGFLESLKKN